MMDGNKDKLKTFAPLFVVMKSSKVMNNVMMEIIWKKMVAFYVYTTVIQIVNFVIMEFVLVVKLGLNIIKLKTDVS